MISLLKRITELIKKEFLYLLIILFFIFLSSRALFHKGFFRTIDDITTVRIIYMVKELQRGNWLNNFPVRWSAELAHGFGYPLYLFYAPLVYYIGSVLVIFAKLSFIVASKWVYFFPFLIGPFLFYYAVRQKMDRLSSIAATCFYILFPFRGYDIYIRGGVGEAWAMAFLPGLIGSIFLLEKKRIGGPLFAFFLALIIISHNISGLIIATFILLLGIVFYLKKVDFWINFILGFLLSAFYWLPSLFYLNIVKVNYSNQNTGQVLNYLEPLKELMRIEIPFNPQGRFSGIFFYILLLFIIIFFIRFGKIKKNLKKEFIFWFSAAIFIYLLQSTLLKFIWEITLPVSRIFQFPWRLLILLSFVFPYLLGISMSLINNYFFRYFFVILLILSTSYYLPAFKPATYSYFYEYSAEDTGICATSWGDEYLPVWVKECAGAKPNKEIDLKDGTVKLIKSNKMSYEAIVETSKKSNLIIYKYYFPGWNVSIDGIKAKLDYTFSKQGIFETQVPKGRHDVKIYYSKTAVMWIADLISISSLIATFFLLSRFFNKKTKK